MNLILGPSQLQTEFTFDIFDALVYPDKQPVDNIGVYFSGGLDSAALLCVVLTELKSTEKLEKIPVKCFTVKKDDFALETSKIALSAISKKFEIAIEHINGIENQSKYHYQIGTKTFIQTYVNHRKTIFYTGINRPPDSEIVEFKHKLKTKYDREKNHKIYYSPFLFLHKPQIIDIFYKLGCEDIIPYTYSCNVNKIVPCGDCYSCEERAWGFKMLDKIDPLFAQK